MLKRSIPSDREAECEKKDQFPKRLITLDGEAESSQKRINSQKMDQFPKRLIASDRVLTIHSKNE